MSCKHCDGSGRGLLSTSDLPGFFGVTDPEPFYVKDVLVVPSPHPATTVKGHGLLRVRAVGHVWTPLGRQEDETVESFPIRFCPMCGCELGVES